MRSRMLSLDDIHKAIKRRKAVTSVATDLHVNRHTLHVFITRFGLHFLDAKKINDYQEMLRVFNYEFLKKSDRDHLVNLYGEKILVEQCDIQKQPVLFALEKNFPGIVDWVILNSNCLNETLVSLGCTDAALYFYLRATFNEDFHTYSQRRRNEKKIIADFFADAKAPEAPTKSQSTEESSPDSMSYYLTSNPSPLFSSAPGLSSQPQFHPMPDVDGKHDAMDFTY